MSSQTVCILGGTGFVGRHLAARLARDGHRLKILTRRREPHRDLLVLPRLIMVEADVHAPEILAAEFAGCDAVVNLVGILNERGRDGRGFYHAHVDLPRKIIQACRESGVRRLLHMSALGADAAYGHSHYQRTKGEGENLVHAAADIHVTSFRPSVIYGPRDAFFNRFARLLRLAPVFPLACPDARLQPVYVGDVVEAFAWSLERHISHGRRYELCGPEVYTLQQMVEYTAMVLGLHRHVIGLGPRLSRWQAHLLGNFPGKPFSWDNYLSLQTDNVCSHNALQDMGIAPSAIETIVPTYLGQ